MVVEKAPCNTRISHGSPPRRNGLCNHRSRAYTADQQSLSNTGLSGLRLIPSHRNIGSVFRWPGYRQLLGHSSFSPAFLQAHSCISEMFDGFLSHAHFLISVAKPKSPVGFLTLTWVMSPISIANGSCSSRSSLAFSYASRSLSALTQI